MIEATPEELIRPSLDGSAPVKSREKIGIFRVHIGDGKFEVVERKLPVTLMRNDKGWLEVREEIDELGRKVTVILEGSV